jgi:chemotaxis protein methyltransferase CheR
VVDGVADALSAYAATDYDRADALARDELARGVDDAALWIVRVRSLANRGDLPGAGEVCAAALDRHRDSAELHYLHAMLLAQASRHADAAQAARRAIYLDRTLVVGHIALGEALSRSGDPRRARIAFESAVALLDRIADDAVPLAADGVPVARLRGVARARLAALIESPTQA